MFNGLSREGILRFAGVYAVGYLINVSCLALLQRLGIGPYVAGLVMIVPMGLVSYALMRRFVFRSARAAS